MASSSASADFKLTNQLSDLVEEGFDVAVRATVRLDTPSLIARKLGQLSLGFYASPNYLGQRGVPKSLAELEQHQCVVFRAADLSRTWTARDSAGSSNVSVRGQIGGDDMGFVRAMLIAGAGIGILPQINCVADEASGRLVRVLPGLHVRGATLYLVYPSTKQVPARVTAFRDFVSDAFAGWSSRQQP